MQNISARRGMLSLRRESRQWGFQGPTVFMMTNGLLGVSDGVGARMEQVSTELYTYSFAQTKFSQCPRFIRHAGGGRRVVHRQRMVS